MPAEESSAFQLAIFDAPSQKVLGQLRASDLDALTPLDALNLLHQLKKNLD